MQLNFVFLTESVNGKGVAVKGEVHHFASLDGKHEDTKQNYSHPFPVCLAPVERQKNISGGRTN